MPDGAVEVKFKPIAGKEDHARRRDVAAGKIVPFAVCNELIPPC